RIGAEQVLADVGARLDGVLLVLPVHDLAEALHQQAIAVALEERIPVAAPQALHDVPAGAAEDRFQLLDDLPVASHRAIEALQLAAEVLDLRQRNPSLEKRARVNPRGRVALEENDIALVARAFALEEMIEADFVQRGRGGERRDVAADPVTELVGANDHRERV